MKVSVIVPTYRRHAFLGKALRSIAEQNYPSDQYEVIVVNDGGAGTNRKNVRDMWTGKCPMLYSRIEHGGQSAANNHALSIASGEYVTLVHDDDFIYPRKLQLLAGFLDAQPDADVVYSLPRYVGSDGGLMDTPAAIMDFVRKYPRYRWSDYEAGAKMLVHGTSTMYRTDVLRKAGGWDTNLQTAEEWEFHLRLLKLGHDFFGVPHVTTAYRIHSGNKSAEYRKDRSPQRSYISRKLKQIPAGATPGKASTASTGAAGPGKRDP